MSTEGGELLRDPVFQLNFALWMLQTLPEDASIRPVLREAGYVLDSISRPLPSPVGLRPRITALTGSPDPASPDVLAEAPGSDRWLMVECKGGSFGTESSNARQAMKLLAVSPDLTDALGLSPGTSRPAHLAYLTVVGDHEALAETVVGLRSRLQEQALPAGEGSAFGISRELDGVYVQRSATGTWPDSVAQVITGPTRAIEVGADEDPRPLYFVPWDPGVDQQPAMREFCRAVLFSRLIAEATATVGRAQIPTRTVLMMDRLLSQATYGVSDRWRSRGDVGKVHLDSKRFLADVLGPLKERLSIALPSGPERVELSLQSEADRDQAIDTLLRADPFGGPAPEDEDQMTLWSE